MPWLFNRTTGFLNKIKTAVTISMGIALNENKQIQDKLQIIRIMNKSNTNLEVLKASLVELKKRYLSNASSENKFAAQNKEYVIGLLKSIA
jgi:hypothetical protein